MRILSVKAMRNLEKESDARGVTYSMMMDRAGRGVADEIRKMFPGGGKCLALVGSGNNGGDALVALRALAENGWEVAAYLVRQRARGDKLMEAVVELGGMIHLAEDDMDCVILGNLLQIADVWLDGVFGTGIQLPLKSEVARILDFVGHFQPRRFTVAVDCPSGVDCDTGDAAKETLPADLTICMEAVKAGLLRFPAFGKVGELRIVNLGLPADLSKADPGEPFVITREIAADQLPERSLDSHKGSFGTALVAAGSINYSGAAWLATSAAYRSGAGLVTLAAPYALHAALSGSLPEVTWLILPDQMGVISAEGSSLLRHSAVKASALLLGPGWGQEDTTKLLLEELLVGVARHGGGAGFLAAVNPGTESHKLPPLIIDADGLKLLAKIPDWWKRLPFDTILTPHPGEMSVLTGLSIGEIQSDRWEVARQYADRWGCVVVLKGALTVIASPDGRFAVLPIATPALARAGTGDVLAGLICGLRAQGVRAFEAAIAGAWIHGQAGLSACKTHGQPISVLAGDVLSAIPGVLKTMTESKKAGA